jgi:hypothetical protein
MQAAGREGLSGAAQNVSAEQRCRASCASAERHIPRPLENPPSSAETGAQSRLAIVMHLTERPPVLVPGRWRKPSRLDPLTVTFRFCRHSRGINHGLVEGGATTMRRLSTVVAVLVGLAGPAIAAGGPGASATTTAGAPVQFNAELAALWTTVLQTPSAQNSFGTGGAAFACWNLDGHTVAPFGPTPVASCTVRPGTKLFVTASSVECSTIEGNGTTEAELRTCAEQSDAQTAPSVTVDGHAVPVNGVETRLMNIVLPADNLFGLPAGTTGQSVGHGWIAPLHPLTPGTHTIVGSGSTFSFSTKIIVRPGR